MNQKYLTQMQHHLAATQDYYLMTIIKIHELDNCFKVNCLNSYASEMIQVLHAYINSQSNLYILSNRLSVQYRSNKIMNTFILFEIK